MLVVMAVVAIAVVVVVVAVAVDVLVVIVGVVVPLARHLKQERQAAATEVTQAPRPSAGKNRGQQG